MVEMAVRHRRVTAVFHGDPVIDGLVHSRDELQDTIERLTGILLGPDPDVADRICMSVLAAGVYGSATDPTLNDVSDEELHRVLLDCAQRLLRAPATPVVSR
jgi:predicted transcriptional regulator